MKTLTNKVGIGSWDGVLSKIVIKYHFFFYDPLTVPPL